MIKTTGSITKEYNNVNEVQVDAFNKCVETGYTVFVHYSDDSCKAKESLVQRILKKIRIIK